MFNTLVFYLLTAMVIIGFSIFLMGAIQQNIALGQGASVKNVTTTEANVNNLVINTVLAGILSGGGIGVIGSILTTHNNNKHNLRVIALNHKQDIEDKLENALRTDRLTEYKKLWRLTRRLAMFYRPQQMKYEDVSRLSEELQTWYFDEGGIFLSEKSRELYKTLQGSLKTTLENHRPEDNQPLPDNLFEDIQKHGHNLRINLRKELGVKE
jgi:hypothetical protein